MRGEDTYHTREVSLMQAVQYYQADIAEAEVDMEQCPYHPLLQERVGKSEAEIAALHKELKEIKETLATISGKLDSRYPSAILWVMTAMGSTIGVLATTVANMVFK